MTKQIPKPEAITRPDYEPKMIDGIKGQAVVDHVLKNSVSNVPIAEAQAVLRGFESILTDYATLYENYLTLGVYASELERQLQEVKAARK